MSENRIKKSEVELESKGKRVSRKVLIIPIGRKYTHRQTVTMPEMKEKIRRIIVHLHRIQF